MIYILTILLLLQCIDVLSLNNTFINNNTFWKSSSDFIPSNNRTYGGIILHRALEMEFKFIYYGKTAPGEWENVFRIGYGGPNGCPGIGMRYPAMFIMKDEDAFQISITHENGCWGDQGVDPYPIIKYHQYHMIIRFNQTWRYISISNGTLTTILVNAVRQSPTNESYIHTFMNVWISQKANSASYAANVTLSDIIINTWDPITPQPTNYPSVIPTNIPTITPTIYTIEPTYNPTINPSFIPTIYPTNNPSIAPTDNPSITPSFMPTINPSTVNPTRQPTEEPTLNPTSKTPTKSPSSNPTVIPTTQPSTAPSEKLIIIVTPTVSPTNNPLHDGDISETNLFTSTITRTSSNVDELSSSWVSSVTEGNYGYLLIPIIIGVGCLCGCILIGIFKKRQENKIMNSTSSTEKKSKLPLKVDDSPDDNDNNNNNDMAEEIIFDKIYNKHRALILEEEKNKRYDLSHKDVLLPNEDSFNSLSSGAAEEMYIPQTHTSTTKHPSAMEVTISPFDVDKFHNNGNIDDDEKNNDNINHDVYDLNSIKKSYSFGSKKIKKQRKYSRQQSKSHSNYIHDLELQHQVTVAISGKNGLQTNDNNNNEEEEEEEEEEDEIIYAEEGDNNNNTRMNMEDEAGSDTEDEDEDEDVDIYHNVAVPSLGPKNNRNRNRMILSLPPRTPELELYGKGNNDGINSNISSKGRLISNNMDFIDDSDGDDDLYGKGNDPIYSPGNDGHTLQQSISALYQKPLRFSGDTEGSGDYEFIEQSLKLCDDIDWQKYLRNFKENKVSDHRLNQLSEDNWKELIPRIGPRNEFKELWKQYQRQRAPSSHL